MNISNTKTIKKAKKTIMVFIAPYLIFFFIMFFVISALFLGVEELWEEFTSTEGLDEITASSNGFVWPVPGYSYISSDYGNRIHPITHKLSFHNGIDIPAPQDTKVVSPVNGTITSVYDSKTVGQTVEIECNEYRFVFHHLNFISAVQGNSIKKGEQLGGVGTTGTLSTGNHLHFTVYKNNKTINPLEIVNFNDVFEKEGS